MKNIEMGDFVFALVVKKILPVGAKFYDTHYNFHRSGYVREVLILKKA
jgi:hypothetical protein